MISKKNCFIHINENYNDFHQQNTMCTFLYIQKTKQIAKRLYTYKNPDTSQKSRQFLLRCYIQKARHFTLRDFPWKFWSWYLYTKNMTLCVTWRFYTQKIQTLRKKHDNLRYVFKYKNPDTLRYAIFMEFLKLAEWGGHLYIKKKTLRYILYAKKMNFALRFYI